MVIDALLLIFAGWGFYQGFSRGIIKTVFTVFSIFLGLAAAFKLAPAATRFIEAAFKTDSPLTFVAGFLLAFFATLIIVRTIAKFLEKTLQTANINVINQFAGGLLLACLYTLVYSMLIWFANQSTIISNEVKKESISYNFIETFPGRMKGVYEYVKPTFKEFWQESVRFIDRMEEKSMEKSESEPNIFDIPEEGEEVPPDEY